MKLPFGLKLRSVLDEFAEIRLVSASLAFSTLLSIIPFFIIVLAGFQSIGGFEEFYPRLEAMLFVYLREATGSSVSRYVKESLTNVDFRALGISGAIFLIWTSLGLIKNIDLAFNRIWKIKLNTPIYKRLWLYWLVIIAIPIGLGVFFGVKSLFFLNQGVRSFEHQALFMIWGWLFLLTLYIVIPATKVRLMPAVISTILVSISLLVVQKSFLWISLKVFRQNKIYGSLASFPIFLIWLLVIWYVVLLGVSLCAFLQQKLLKRTLTS